MGKILLQGESLKTERITEEQCDCAINDFCDMHDCATRAKDRFYAEDSLYGDNEAPIYRYFADWSTFHLKEYAKGVSFNSYSRLQSVFVQNPNMDRVENKEQFNQLENPRALGGFRIPGAEDGLLIDVESWRKWRECWFCKNQELIVWNDWDNDYFVNQDVNDEILKNEIRKFIDGKGKSGCTDEKIDEVVSAESQCHEDGDVHKPIAKNALAIYFHKIIMSSYAGDGERQGYLTEIGGRICRGNYYIELHDLSAMEKEAAHTGRDNTQRSIWGIKNDSGQWKFISFDFEKGMFEFHDDSGAHKGEYRFDGSKNADAQTDHSLKCVKDWKKKHKYNIPYLDKLGL